MLRGITFLGTRGTLLMYLTVGTLAAALVLALLIVCAIAQMQSVPRANPKVKAPPKTRYRVYGHDPTGTFDIEAQYDANTETDARAAAERDGMVVKAVKRVGGEPPATTGAE